MDETLAQALRETQAKLEAAREDADTLRALLALRTHQHDAAWQSARRSEAALAAARTEQPAVAEEPEQAEPPGEASAPAEIAPDAGTPDAAEALARAREETEAVRAVLGAVLGSLGRRGLDRRRFQEIVAEAGRRAPDTGPGAARHAVLLAEARRVLGVPG